MAVYDNLLKLQERIRSACLRSGRDPERVILVAVSKGRTVDEIKEAVEAGLNDIGESRVQEALAKFNELASERVSEKRIRWHLIGQLQTNKARDAVKAFDLIHSVDSLRLAQEIDRQAARMGKMQEILIEVKTSPEATKFGVNPQEAERIIKEITKFKNIKLKGLMTVAPVVDSPEKTRPYFRALREISESVNKLQVASCNLSILSMGMSDDFEVAIEEGATMVRIGRAIFETSS
jgi:PLP dependent protein